MHLPPINFKVRRRHAFGFSTNRPRDLTVNPVRITHRVDNLPTNFGISGKFCSQLIGQHLLYASRDLATLTFDLLTSK